MAGINLATQFGPQVGTFRALQQGEFVHPRRLSFATIHVRLTPDKWTLDIDRDLYRKLQRRAPKAEQDYYPRPQHNQLALATNPVLRAVRIQYPQGSWEVPRNKRREIQVIRLAFDDLPENRAYIESLHNCALDAIIMWNHDHTFGVALPADLDGARSQGYVANADQERTDVALFFYPKYNGDQPTTPAALDPKTGLTVQIPYQLWDGTFGTKVGSMRPGLYDLEFIPNIGEEKIKEQEFLPIEDRELGEDEFRLEHHPRINLHGGIFPLKSVLKRFGGHTNMSSEELEKRLNELLKTKCNPALMRRKHQKATKAEREAVILGAKQNAAKVRAAFGRAIELAEAREAEEAKQAETEKDVSQDLSEETVNQEPKVSEPEETAAPETEIEESADPLEEESPETTSADVQEPAAETSLPQETNEPLETPETPTPQETEVS